MAFSEEEKARVLHFLGYPSLSQLSASIQLGIPAGAEPLFLLEDALTRLRPGGEDAVRRDLCECESIEEQLSSARGRMRATQLGEIKLRENEAQMLRTELGYWTMRLSDDIGVFVNPYAQAAGGFGGGINSKVMG